MDQQRDYYQTGNHNLLTQAGCDGTQAANLG